jgi:hypothetical protein
MSAGAASARVVHDHFGGAERFQRISAELMDPVDKAGSAAFTLQEILEPDGWILLLFLMDPRTGLGRFREFRISNHQLMVRLVDACTKLSVEDILHTRDVAERVALYRAHHDDAVAQIRRCAHVRGSVVVLDLREEEVIHPTNRFML